MGCYGIGLKETTPAEVTQNNLILIFENIRRTNIAMNDTLILKVEHNGRQLHQYFQNLPFLKLTRRQHFLLKRLTIERGCDIEAMLCFHDIIGMQDIGMPHFFECFSLVGE